MVVGLKYGVLMDQLPCGNEHPSLNVQDGEGAEEESLNDSGETPKLIRRQIHKI